MLIKDKNITQPLRLYGIDIQAEPENAGQHVLHIYKDKETTIVHPLYLVLSA